MNLSIERMNLLSQLNTLYSTFTEIVINHTPRPRLELIQHQTLAFKQNKNGIKRPKNLLNRHI